MRRFFVNLRIFFNTPCESITLILNLRNLSFKFNYAKNKWNYLLILEKLHNFVKISILAGLEAAAAIKNTASFSIGNNNNLW